MTSMEKRKKRPIPRTTPREWTDRLHVDEIRRAIPVIPVDDHSTDTCSDLSVGTPSSILMNGYSMSRDLSDLSGSYYMMNGNHTILHSDQQRVWRQAHMLSRREPVHPQPPSDCDDSVRMDHHGKSLLVMDDANSDMIEIVQQVEDRTLSSESTFLPIILLLMDPGQKMYELMQLWIDVQHDTVRDVLQSIQSNLGEQWRQDYDGMFHWRNHQLSQLIHILDVNKYDVQPFEVWVAKPWSMSAPNAVAYASSALHHLKQIGVFQATDGNRSDPMRRGEALSTNKLSGTKETYLCLSHEAQSRIYVMGGMFKHHHACQFLSFSPTFESAVEVVRVDVLGAAQSTDEASCVSTDVPLATVLTEQIREPTRIATPGRIEKTPTSGDLQGTPETVPCESPDHGPVEVEEKVVFEDVSEESSVENCEVDEPIRKFREHRRRRRLKELVSLFKCKPCRLEQNLEGSQRTLWLSSDQASTAFRGTDRPLWETAWDFDGNASLVSESEPLLLKNSSDVSYQLEMYRYEI